MEVVVCRKDGGLWDFGGRRIGGTQMEGGPLADWQQAARLRWRLKISHHAAAARRIIAGNSEVMAQKSCGGYYDDDNDADDGEE